MYKRRQNLYEDLSEEDEDSVFLSPNFLPKYDLKYEELSTMVSVSTNGMYEDCEIKSALLEFLKLDESELPSSIHSSLEMAVENAKFKLNSNDCLEWSKMKNDRVVIPMNLKYFASKGKNSLVNSPKEQLDKTELVNIPADTSKKQLTNSSDQEKVKLDQKDFASISTASIMKIVLDHSLTSNLTERRTRLIDRIVKESKNTAFVKEMRTFLDFDARFSKALDEHLRNLKTAPKLSAFASHFNLSVTKCISSKKKKITELF